MQLRDDNRGFTLIEVTIILLVLVILSTIMLPQLGNFNRLARFVKVKEDLGAICSGMKKMLDEVMLGGFYGEPRWREQPIGLLVGPGRSPVGGSSGGNSNWLENPGATFGEETDVLGTQVYFKVDRFENHLQQNNPLEEGSQDPSFRYKNPIDNPQRWAAGAFFGWRGPYFDEFTTDAWGNRYASNVFALHRDKDAEEGRGLFTSAVVCLSAGPDGAVDTSFNQSMNDGDGDGFNGWRTADDDLAVILSAGGPF